MPRPDHNVGCQRCAVVAVVSLDIDQIVDDAQKRADIWYGNKSKISQQIEAQDKIDPNSLIDDETPLTPVITEPKKKTGLSKAQAAKEARNKLIAAMSEEQSNGEIIDQENITLPDGQVVKVNIRT